MKRNRKGVNLVLLGLIAGGIGLPFILPTLFTSPPISHRSIETPPSDQTRSDLSVQELLETTYLGHSEEYPDPEEPAVVLKKYVERDTHKYLEGEREQMQELDQEIAEWEMLVREYPQSRHALTRLAELYRNKAKLTQDKSWSRKAADHYIQAAEIGLSRGLIRYTRELSELLVDLNDKAELDEIFAAILAQPRDVDRGHYYQALVDYGDGLAWLKDDQRAWGYFEDAINFHPEQNIEAINRYTRHLLDRGQAQQVFDVLESRLTSEARTVYVLPAYFRQEAMQLLGMDTASAEAETALIRERLAEGSWVVQLPPKVQSWSDLALVSEAFATPGPLPNPPWEHTEASDDCRDVGWQATDNFCHDLGGIQHCFAPIAINLAEVITNEASTEKIGARYMVAWTVKNRAFQTLTPLAQCNAYPGGKGAQLETNCFPGIPDGHEIYHTESKRVCCVIHGGTTQVSESQFQFDDEHVDFQTLWLNGAIWAATWVLDGNVPDVSTGWVPPGVSGCTFKCGAKKDITTDQQPYPNPTSGGPWCSSGFNFFDPSPNGPMEYRGCTYTPSNASACLWSPLPNDVCGNSTTDYVCSSKPNPPPPSDNHFWNRRGPSLAAPIGYFDGIDSNYLAQGWALDPDTPIASIAIHIYIDGPAGRGGMFIASFSANQPRPDVKQGTGYPGKHGWSWEIPSQYRTAPHTYYAYAIDQTGTYNPQLSSSPRTK